MSRPRKSGRHDDGRLLESQIPEGGFPSGVAVPSLCLLVLLLGLAALTGVLLDGRADSAVPRAFTDSQQRLAADIARSVGISAGQNLNELRLATSSQTGGPVEPLLEKLDRQPRWRGVAVFGGPERGLLATRGEQVPPQAVPATVTDAAFSSVVAGNGELLIATTLALPGDRLLTATTAVKLPKADADPALRQSLHLTTLGGQAVGVSRSAQIPDDPALADLVAQAGREAARGTGVLLGPVSGDTQATVAYAPIAVLGGTHALDFAVVTTGQSPAGTTATGGSGIVPAAALAVVAVGGFVLLRLFFVRPVRRLRGDSLAVAGGDLDAEIRTSAISEVGRVAAAVRACRASLTKHEEAGARPRGISAIVVVSVAAVAVVGWSAGVVTLLADRSAQVPDVLVTSLRGQTERTADALRRSVNDGLADLADVVTAQGADGPAAVHASVGRLAADQPRYRSVYLVDRSGVAQEHVGRVPLRAVERPPAKAGIRQQNNSGRVPVIFAHVPLPDGKHTLVGEFDLDHIANLLSQAPGRVRVVDADFRTISATAGYVAFEQVTDRVLRDSIVLARRGDPVAAIQDGPNGESFVSSAPVYGGDTGKLGWTVLAEHPVTELALPVNDMRRHAELVALVGVLLASLLFGWHLFGLINPLRRVAAAADRLTGGDRDTVIYPQRHDEIGTIASCLEVCRQAVAEGRDRLGEVRRPRGSATDETTLMRPVAKPDLPEQRPRRKAVARSASGDR